jgi:intracellular sulfur oxidation DsrE/DsrF family protein
MLKLFAKAAAITLALGLTAGSAALAADAAKKHHVVFHVTEDDPVKWNQTLNNAGNLQKAVGKDNVEIEVVANGPGLNMMKFESSVANRMNEAMGNGVAIVACGATMKAAKLTEKDLYPGVKVVPGGVVEIMNRQEAGWSYIKN